MAALADPSANGVAPCGAEELAAMQAHYLEHGFCYVRGAVAPSAVDELVDDLWDQASLKTSAQWNGEGAGKSQ